MLKGKLTFDISLNQFLQLGNLFAEVSKPAKVISSVYENDQEQNQMGYAMLQLKNHSTAFESIWRSKY